MLLLHIYNVIDYLTEVGCKNSKKTPQIKFSYSHLCSQCGVFYVA